MTTDNVIDAEFVNQIYTMNLEYRNGYIASVTGLSLMNILHAPVKHYQTFERPQGITIYPIPPDRFKESIRNTLKEKLHPGVPKGEVKYAN